LHTGINESLEKWTVQAHGFVTNACPLYIHLYSPFKVVLTEKQTYIHVETNEQNTHKQINSFNVWLEKRVVYTRIRQ